MRHDAEFIIEGFVAARAARMDLCAPPPALREDVITMLGLAFCIYLLLQSGVETVPSRPGIESRAYIPPTSQASSVSTERISTSPQWARKRSLVFAFLPAITIGLSRLPSLDLPFFFGRHLRESPWMLGFQFTFSGGGAERYSFGLSTHRYHITAMRSFGRRDRLMVTVGGGLALLVIRPVIEAEARTAVRFGKRRRGHFGLIGRFGWNVGYGELAPMPQLGVLIGVSMI